MTLAIADTAVPENPLSADQQAALDALIARLGSPSPEAAVTEEQVVADAAALPTPEQDALWTALLEGGLVVAQLQCLLAIHGERLFQDQRRSSSPELPSS